MPIKSRGGNTTIILLHSPMSLVYKDNTLSSVLIEFQELEVLKFAFIDVVNSNQSVRDFHTSSTESWFIFSKAV